MTRPKSERDKFRVIDGEANDPKAKPKASAPWNTYLLKNKQGAYLACIPNFVLILANEDVFEHLGYNEFAGRVEKLEPIEWDEDYQASGDEAGAGPFTQDDVTRAAAWIGTEYNIPIQSLGPVDAAIKVVAKRRPFHPVRDYLDAVKVKWDQKPRVDTSLIRWCGAKDTPYTRAVGRFFAIGAVARIYRPGCKLDTVLVLEGDENLGKSSFFRELASEPWFLETSMNLGTKDAFQDMRSKWIVEFAELGSFSKTEEKKVQAFISKQKDTYRETYARSSEDHLRQCAFGASTNKRKYLREATGNRRYLPAEVRKIDLDLLRRERDQYWAEAAVLFERGEPWHVTDWNLLQEFRDEQEDRREIDPWEPAIAAWLANPKTALKHNGEKFIPVLCDLSDGVLTKDILHHCFKIELKDQTKQHEMKVTEILTEVLGYIKGTLKTINGVRARRYVPGPKAARGGSGGSDGSSETAEKKRSRKTEPPEPPNSNKLRQGGKGQKGHKDDPTRGSKTLPFGGSGGSGRNAARRKAGK